MTFMTTDRGFRLQIRRVLTIPLIATQTLLTYPVTALAQEAASKPASAGAPEVTVNRTIPRVTPPPTRPVFSDPATDGELLRARVFPEPLVPVGASNPADNTALAHALLAYLDRQDPENLTPIARFMEARPTSAWQPSLLLNTGLVLLRHGYFTRAGNDFAAAWRLVKNDASRNGRAVADAAVGELLQLESRLGHVEQVENLLTELGDRPVTGAATERVANARQAAAVMRTAPDEAFRCGPYALAQVLTAVRSAAVDPKILMIRTGPKGSSVAQLIAWAAGASVTLFPVRHAKSTPFGVPSIVHFRAGHFAAIIRRDGDRYLLRDGTFGAELWISAAALDEETTEAMIVPGDLSAGWDPLPSQAAADTWGRGFPSQGPGGDGPGPNDDQTDPPCPPGGPGMPTYRINLMFVSLTIVDTPLTYTPPVGPAVRFTFTYNQRESHQPQTFTYTNLGAKWTSDWIAYVTDDPLNPNAAVTLFNSGGGEDTFSGFDPVSGQYAPETRNREILTRTGTSPIRYERARPDGSVDVFTQPDGASGYPRKVFLTERHDRQGNALTFTYDAQLRLVAVADALGQVTTLAYGLPQDVWKVTRVTDPFGRRAVLTYDDSGRLQTTTDTIGLTSSFNYAADGFIQSLTTPYGTSRFTKTDGTLDRSLEATDPAGGKERVEYHANDTGIPMTDPVGTVPTVAGATFSNNFLQYRNTFYWDKRAMALAPGDRTKAHIYHWLHIKGNVNQSVSILESEKAPLENRVWYLYPNQASSVFEGDGREPSLMARVLDDGTTQVFKTEFNSLGNVTKRIDPIGRETTFNYASNGIDLTSVKQTTAGLNDVLASITYNAHHQPLTITDAAGQPSTFAYNGAGQPLTVTNAKNETTTLSYNTAGYLEGVTGAITGAVVGITYDGYGRVRTVTNPDTYALTYDYDALNRPTTVTYPDGSYESLAYDRLDLVRQRDRFGRWTTIGYDALRRPVSIRDPLGRVVRQSWCTCGSLESLTDPKGNVTAWDRDVMGRATKETRANGSFTTYTYEMTTSRLKSVTDPKLQVTTYAYARDGALTGLSYTNAQIATPNVSLTYDTNYLRLATMVDGIGTTTYAYHPVGGLGAGQVASIDGPLSNDTISYGYDELGRIGSRTLNSVTDTWTYDALGRVATQVDPIGTFNYAYDGATPRLHQLTYPNGQTSTYTYFGNTGDHRLQDIHHQTGAGATLSRFSYLYDRAGNITTWTQQYESTVRAYDFTYDAADQLTGAVYRSTDPTPTVLKRYGYAYDAAGNRTTARTDDAPIQWTYDAMNRITGQAGGGVVRFEGSVSEPATVTVAGQPASVSGTNAFAGSAVLPVGTTTVAIAATDASGNAATQSYEVDVASNTNTFSYDANGNLATQGTKTYEWDAANRLTRVLDGATELARFSYDGLGRRAQKIAGGVTQSFVYDGRDIVQDRPSPGGTSRHLHGPGVDQVLMAIDAAGTPSYYLPDHLGSIVQQTNSTGAVVAARQYDPYGNALVGGAASGYGFSGREWDPEVSLYFLRARYYDAAIGQFISEDPVGPVQASRYAYVDGAPTRWIDPFGFGPLKPGPPPMLPDGRPAPPPASTGYDPTWKYVAPDPNKPGSRGKWVPTERGPGSKPQVHWDDEDGYWTRDDGKGNRTHFDPEGELYQKPSGRPRLPAPPAIPAPWWPETILPLPKVLICTILPQLCQTWRCGSGGGAN